MEPILETRSLTVDFETENGVVRAVDGFDLDLNAGECLALVGESGSGKTQACLAMLGLLAGNASVAGSVLWHGEELLAMPRERIDDIRGRSIAMVFQDALSAMTPNVRIGRQMEEVAIRHLGIDRATARARAIEALESVRIPAATERIDAYPFELSGGMRQRALIALALLTDPEVLIADEPTTALDVTVQADVLKLLDERRRTSGTAILMITHDLGVVAGLCDRVQVMYAGRTVESGPTRDVFRAPRHPYTQGLLRSIPRSDTDPRQPLPGIPGQPARPGVARAGCPFQPRCTEALPICSTLDPETAFDGDRAVACHAVVAP